MTDQTCDHYYTMRIPAPIASRIRARDDEQGYACYRLDTHSQLLLCHANDSGILDIPDDLLRDATYGDTYIVCCHPARVVERYPSLADAVVGDWDGVTLITWDDDGLIIYPQ